MNHGQNYSMDPTSSEWEALVHWSRTELPKKQGCLAGQVQLCWNVRYHITCAFNEAELKEILTEFQSPSYHTTPFGRVVYTNPQAAYEFTRQCARGILRAVQLPQRQVADAVLDLVWALGTGTCFKREKLGLLLRPSLDGTFHDDDLNVIDEIQHRCDSKLLPKQEQLHSMLALTGTVAQLLKNADGPKKNRLHTPLALIQLECLDRSIQVCLTRS